VLEKLTREMFAEQLNTNFVARLDNQRTAEFHLYEVATMKSAPGQEQFSLFFRSSEMSLGQGTFQMEHPGIGNFPLFLVPIGPDAQGMRYEAAFNRFIKQN
jgi:hypothetical protein